MSESLVPSRVEPRYMTRIWGARWLDPLFAEPEELAQPVGEVWLTGEECRLLDGPAAGRTLGDAWAAMPTSWKGTRLDRETGFPILAKFLFPKRKLSIQVHPDDDYAARHEHGRGKTEMWHAVAARDDAKVYVGLKEGTTPEALRRAVADGSVEGQLRELPVAAGDTFFVPAGTVHTIGPDVVLCEVQEYSDLTYRLWDYGREDANGKPRELHPEKAMDVVRIGTPAAGKTVPLAGYRGPLEVSYLAACRHFAVERWRFVEPADVTTSKEHFDILIFLGGQGKIVTGDVEQEYHHGEAWFFPANLGEYRLVSPVETTLLRAYVPDLDALAGQLRKEGAKLAQIMGFLFS